MWKTPFSTVANLHEYSKHACVTDSVSNKTHEILVFKMMTFANEALTGLPIYVSDLLALGWFELIHIKHILLKAIAKSWMANMRWICSGTSYILFCNCNLMSCFQFMSLRFMNELIQPNLPFFEISQNSEAQTCLILIGY